MKWLHLLWLTIVWSIQYTVVVPTIWLYRVLSGALAVGALGVLLVCLPVIGWVILAVLLMGTPTPSQRERRRSRRYLRPWGLSLLR